MSTLASVIIRDVTSARPAAGIAGRLFFATDTSKTWRDNGTSWDDVSSGGAGSNVISSIVLSSAAPSFSFTGIPGTFRDLVLRIDGRGDVSATAVIIAITFNGDSGANYDEVGHYANTGWNQSTANAITGGVFAGNLATMPAATAAANYSGGIEFRVFNYAGTTFYKRGTWFGAYLNGSVSTANFYETAGGFFWRNTAAITSITASTASGNFAAGSSAVLYGM